MTAREGLNIPADWDGESWTCIQVQFPQSDEWLAILNGVLSQFERGWTWNRNSGSIKEAQAVGAEIWLRNEALISCEGEPIPQPEPEIIIRLCAAETDETESEEEEMTCNGPSLPIKWGDDGKLYYWHCCAWELVPGDMSVDEGIPSGYEDDMDPVPELSACGKATAIIEAIYLVATGMFESGSESPFTVVNFIKEYSAPYTIKTKYAWEGYAESLILRRAGLDEEDIFDAVTKQEILCRLVRTISATTADLTDADVHDIETAFNLNTGFDSAIFGVAANALGKSQLSDIAKAGALVTAGNCDCPEYPTGGMWPTYWGEGFDWSHTWDFTQALPAEVSLSGGNNPRVWTAGVGIQAEISDVSGRNQVGFEIAFPNTGGTAMKWAVIVAPQRAYSYGFQPPYIGGHAHSIVSSLDDYPDTNPSAGEVWTLTKIVSLLLDSGESPLTVTVDGTQAAPWDVSGDPGSLVIRGFAIAGGGTDPFGA